MTEASKLSVAPFMLAAPPVALPLVPPLLFLAQHVSGAGVPTLTMTQP